MTGVDLPVRGVGDKVKLLLLTAEELGNNSGPIAGALLDILVAKGDCEEEAVVSAEDETPAGVVNGGGVGVKVWPA